MVAIASALAEVEASCAFVRSVAGTQLHVQMSAQQAAKLAACVQKNPLPFPAEIPNLLEHIRAAGFCQDDFNTLVVALAGPPAPPASARQDTTPKHSKMQQDFKNFWWFLRESDWRRAMSREEDAIKVFTDIMSSLGCRNPCELTSQAATAAVPAAKLI